VGLEGLEEADRPRPSWAEQTEEEEEKSKDGQRSHNKWNSAWEGYKPSSFPPAKEAGADSKTGSQLGSHLVAPEHGVFSPKGNGPTPGIGRMSRGIWRCVVACPRCQSFPCNR
jgi:hypothetical protein